MNISISPVLEEQDQNRKKMLYTTSRQKKIDRFVVHGFFYRYNFVFEAMGCFYHFCPCQEVRPSLTEKDIQPGIGKGGLKEWRRSYIQEKTSTVIEM